VLFKQPLYGLFPTAGFQINTERSSLADSPCSKGLVLSQTERVYLIPNFWQAQS
jgi:hypothetical protein